jgi:malonate transporter and related proteins
MVRPGCRAEAMLNTVSGALLPIVVTLLLGFVAGWHHDFDTSSATVLNRIVMLYALPLSLFTGLLSTNRDELTSDAGLAAAITVAMLLSYAVALLLARYAFAHPLGTAALIGLAVGAPSAAFVGTSVLGYLFGDASAVPIAIAGLALNLVEVPVSLVLLSIATEAASSGTEGRSLRAHVMTAVSEPVVWAPITAFVLVVVGVDLPTVLDDSLKLLGTTTGGVALFASGIVLYAQRVSITRTVVATVLARNILVPALLWAVIIGLGASAQTTREAVLTLAIPTSSICVILAVQFKEAEREMASTLLISTLASIGTMGAFIALT